MTLINVKNGHDITIPGVPDHRVVAAPRPSRVAVSPARIPFIKPRLDVQEGDTVRIGSPLFFDKRHPDVHYRSPGAGTISEIRFGPRRVILNIVIDLDDAESNEALPNAKLDAANNATREQVIAALLAGGLWPLIRALPYRDMAPVDGPAPPMIIVSLSNREPFHPHPDVYLAGREALFSKGLGHLKRLAPKVLVTVDAEATSAIALLGETITHRHRGAYPAGDPGTTLYCTRTSSTDNPAWYISGQDLLLIAELLETGVYPTERLVAVGGPAAADARHVMTRMGAPLSDLVAVAGSAPARILSGGLYTGSTVTLEDYLGFLDTAVTALPEGVDEEFLALVAPGRRRASYSRAFLSAVAGGDMDVDCNFHGELRACVACSYCNRVCPVEILPQLAFKSLLAEEIEEALAHGLLDCVECGLCSYVCPAKIDISDILIQGKRDYYKEQQA